MHHESICGADLLERLSINFNCCLEIISHWQDLLHDVRWVSGHADKISFPMNSQASLGHFTGLWKPHFPFESWLYGHPAPVVVLCCCSELLSVLKHITVQESSRHFFYIKLSQWYFICGVKLNLCVEQKLQKFKTLLALCCDTWSALTASHNPTFLINQDQTKKKRACGWKSCSTWSKFRQYIR